MTRVLTPPRFNLHPTRRSPIDDRFGDVFVGLSHRFERPVVFDHRAVDGEALAVLIDRDREVAAQLERPRRLRGRSAARIGRAHFGRPLRGSPAARRPLDKQARLYEDHWRAILEEGQRRGTLAKSLDAELAMRAILGMCNTVARWSRASPAPSLDTVADSFARLVLGGVSGAAEKKRRPR